MKHWFIYGSGGAKSAQGGTACPGRLDEDLKKKYGRHEPEAKAAEQPQAYGFICAFTNKEKRRRQIPVTGSC